MELLIAGKILGSHHLKGEVKVVSDIENINELEGNKILLDLENKEQKILTIAKINHFVGNKWIFSFEEIKNKQDTLQIRNALIKVRRDLLGIGEDEILLSDFIGLEVYNIKEDSEEKEYLGKVVEIFETGAHNIYVVESEDFETMIPDVDIFIKKIDFKKRIIETNILEGMKEIKKKK